VTGTCITTVNADGSTTSTCVSSDNSIQIGTGH
jgi:hypothetical protein